MDCKRRFYRHLPQEMGIYPAPALSLSTNGTVQSLDTNVPTAALLPTFARLATQFLEFGRLLALFLKFYFHARLLMAQNRILNLKLQLWEITFWCSKLQIFFIRLAHGFPLSECWPRIKSMNRH
jgi:hypothetical protein